MINFRNPKAARFAVTIFSMGVVALSLPASAGGHGGGGGAHMGGGGGQGGPSHGPPHPPPPLILASGAAGRAVGSNCFKPVVDAHGTCGGLPPHQGLQVRPTSRLAWCLSHGPFIADPVLP
jgi:hypothetical protein